MREFAWHLSNSFVLKSFEKMCEGDGGDPLAGRESIFRRGGGGENPLGREFHVNLIGCMHTFFYKNHIKFSTSPF